MKRMGRVFLAFALSVCMLAGLTGAAVPAKNVKQESDLMHRAKNFNEIKAALRETGLGQFRYVMYGAMKSMAMDADAAAGGASASMATADLAVEEAMAEPMENGSAISGTGDGDFSATNVQVEGIDEADIVKTDGEYLYIAGNSKVYIVSANQGAMRKTAEITLEDERNVRNIFIDKNRLIVFGQEHRKEILQEEPAADIPENRRKVTIDSEVSIDESADTASSTAEAPKMGALAVPEPSYIYRPYTYIAIYDTEKKGSPALLQEVTVSGDFVSARKTDGYLYITARRDLYGVANLERAGEKDILPLYQDSIVSSRTNRVGEKVAAGTVDVDGELMRVLTPQDVYLCPVNDEASFTTLAVLAVSGDREAELTSYMGSLDEFYMSGDSIYLTFSEYEYNQKRGESKTTTNLVALDVDGMNTTYRAEGSVAGNLLNQFSMDEYNGYLRIATTDGDKGANLYVLDGNLNETGSIRGIAEGERIYAVRFMGDKGYVVTFENVDPFFTVDLSDPAAPKVVGELKLPGYSSYLHPIDENTVLGVGRETKELFTRDESGKEEMVGYREGGLKLSLFDVSDFANPKQLDKLILGDETAWSDVTYDHKALMVDRARNLVGFCLDSYNDEGIASGAYLFSVTGGAIEQVGMMEQKEAPKGTFTVYSGVDSDEEVMPGFYFDRLCYIGDVYYYLQNGMVRSYARDGLGEIAELALTDAERIAVKAME